MQRSMLVLQDQQVQENRYYYDHPYFGQILLGGLLFISGYPQNLDLSGSAYSVESLYLVPKIWMGLLAVLDTFLLFKIVEKKFDNINIAFLAAVLFAVMPSTWYFRRILLESLMMPLMLASILLALWLNSRLRDRPFVALSGACLGLAIFTKIPAFVMMPLVGYTTWSQTSANRRIMVIIWLVPVILIPLLWPFQSMSTGTFDSWVNGVMGQTQREHGDGVAGALRVLLDVDPTLLLLGAAGSGYFTLRRRDPFLLLWIAPFLIFLSLIGYIQYFHISPLLPAFCIGAAFLLNEISQKFKQKIFLSSLAPLSVALFGLVSTGLLITTDVASAQYEATAYALSLAYDDATIIANPVYSWPYRFVYHMPHTFSDYRDAIYHQISTENVVLISELHFLGSVNEPTLSSLYNNTRSSMTFDSKQQVDPEYYPYTSLRLTGAGDNIDVRRGHR